MYRFTHFLLILFVFFSCSRPDKVTEANYNVVPLPQSIDYIDKTNFVLDQSTQIVYNTTNPIEQKLANLLSESIYSITGQTLRIVKKDDIPSNNYIELKVDFKNENYEAYNLTVTDKSIAINGNSVAGLFYGIQTLCKSIPTVNDRNINFRSVSITDYPAYTHRGALLDVSRHFFDANFVKKYIDALALSNMNVFHWHLTDDQGWRIEIKKYPKLTEIGSKRDSTIIGRHTATFNHKPVEGFYTQAEIKDIIEYASLRNITIIPEIDLPGHMLAALASYPELGCTGGPYSVGCEWGIYEDVLCAGNEQVFTFLDDVLDEVTNLFPGKYIHIGGDECLKNRWMACPKCKAKIRQLQLRHNAEHSVDEQLQSYFIARIEKMINEKGKQIIGWDEILEGGIAPNATIMSWRGTKGGIYAANKGHDVIMTPESHVYLDYYQSADVDNEPYAFGWLTDLKKVYSFDPMPKDLDADKKKHILGAQVNLWAEYMPTSKHVEYMLLPRMAALAETVWSNPTQKNYNNFVYRLYGLSKHFDRLGYENAKHVYGIQDSIVVDTVNNDIKVYLSNFDKTPIYDKQDKPVNSPLTVNSTNTLQASFTRENDSTQYNYIKQFNFNKATAKPITLKHAPAERYTFAGATTLVDGQLGATSSYRTGTWLGFYNSDFEATINLKETSAISSVSLNVFANTRGLLFPPTSITIYTSKDGKRFTPTHYHNYPLIKKHISPTTTPLVVTFKETEARYVRILLKTSKSAPLWHEKKGEKTYLMLDEIIIN